MYVYYVSGIPFGNELYHHGIKGQKWGVRRYQNEDGSLTDSGRAHYQKLYDRGKTLTDKGVGKGRAIFGGIKRDIAISIGGAVASKLVRDYAAVSIASLVGGPAAGVVTKGLLVVNDLGYYAAMGGNLFKTVQDVRAINYANSETGKREFGKAKKKG